VLRFFLLRHAQSTWNAQRRWQGHADPPLSEVGRNSAETIAPLYENVSAIHCSPLLRSLETAEIIGKVLGLDQPFVNENLSERNLGEWTGLTRKEVDQKWPGYLDTHRWPPGAETNDSIRQRALRGLREIIEQTKADFGGAADVDGVEADAADVDEVDVEVLIVTHGGLITTVEQSLGHKWRRIVNLSGRELIAVDGSLELGRILDRPDELSHSVFEKDSPDQEVL